MTQFFKTLNLGATSGGGGPIMGGGPIPLMG
eukprot:CAMPEP_0178441212 /NCGR_PEP_ID=MMETSP0689_2-20121128/37340_1 /TAXON_ID=160604 /ORGANISM="Amphidinium massartii, Strain CS-259" /LENGTH=30 /DNA_ID= /DNA_START= /DNA_END= /DNA_ORIENTATION=